MIDFTSSLYLAMKHSSAELAPWHQFTSGKPAAIFEPLQSKELGFRVAGMQGLEHGSIARSTLHLYNDLYSLLSEQAINVFVDECVYPVSKYGIEKLYLNKIPVYPFKHLDSVHLQKLITDKAVKQRRPVVITDGWCPQCGRPAPITNYSKILRPFAGNMIIDDTQAFGIFGKRTSIELFGKGGGGILQWLNVNDHRVVTIVSMAKAFGVPLAVISASGKFIESFKNASHTITYSSPPSLVDIGAGLHALHSNSETGDQIRQKLFKNVRLFRNHFKNAGLNINGGIFPVQSLSFPSNRANNIFDTLDKQGIKTVLTTNHHDAGRSVTFVIRCDHTKDDIERLAYSIKKVQTLNM